ncbi:MAG: GNAT family N-acetyltransferase [Hyphomonadaceae bacterium]
MDGADGLIIETCGGLSALAPEAWDAVANPLGAAYDPFLSWAFLEALESSGCATRAKGWAPVHLLAREGGRIVGALPLYLKSHSYGEYVFDHAWADELMRAGGRYYPKLQCAVPFTPATGRRLLAEDARVQRALVGGALELAQRANASSLHITFCTESEAKTLGALGLMQRTGVQFHWTNEGFASFEDFLSALSSQKRKNIRKERARAQAGVRIRAVGGREITERDWDFFFACYMDTGGRKWGAPYLNREFFQTVGERMAERIVLFLAEEDGAPIASALNFIGGDTLYGRYWGRLEEREFLHFELCYYQAIDYAITHGLARVEAGAQGEHKLARGYAPQATYSAHWIAHPGLRDAVANYLESERPAIAEEIEILDAHTPFKKGD